jgi:L-threonylcarbamoyladenylate synthase
VASDATGPLLRVVRNGAVSLQQLREHVPGVLGLGEIPMADEPEADSPATEAPHSEAPADAAASRQDSPRQEPDAG